MVIFICWVLVPNSVEPFNRRSSLKAPDIQLVVHLQVTVDQFQYMSDNLLKIDRGKTNHERKKETNKNASKVCFKRNKRWYWLLMICKLSYTCQAYWIWIHFLLLKNNRKKRLQFGIVFLRTRRWRNYYSWRGGLNLDQVYGSILGNNQPWE